MAHQIVRAHFLFVPIIFQFILCLQNRGAHILFDVRPLFGILGYIFLVKPIGHPSKNRVVRVRYNIGHPSKKFIFYSVRSIKARIRPSVKINILYFDYLFDST